MNKNQHITFRHFNTTDIYLFLAFGLSLWLSGYFADLTSWYNLRKLSLWWLLIAGTVLLTSLRFDSQRLYGYSIFVFAVFALDLSATGVVRQFFGDSPNPTLIIESIANTNKTETYEFFTTHKNSIIKSFTFLACVLTSHHFLWHILKRRTRSHHRTPPIWLTTLLLITSIGLSFHKGLQNANPFLKWPLMLLEQYRSLKEVAQAKAELLKARSNSKQWGLQVKNDKQRTILIIIGESSNRLNWSLYGYERPTTKPLEKTLGEIGGQFTLFDQAYSQFPSTLKSLQSALTPATESSMEMVKTTPDVLALADAAGFKVTWLSNQTQHDGWFGAIADAADDKAFTNLGSGRGSNFLDEGLIPELESRLKKPKTQDELIVIHLLGQHYRYEQRCPKEQKIFNEADNDSVTQEMRLNGRLPNIRAERDEYDNAIYCGAIVLSDILKLVSVYRSDQASAVLFFSDHGQEVGHNRNFVGHSSKDLTGYQIPLWLWTNRSWNQPLALEQQNFKSPYRLDFIDNSIQTLLGISSNWYDPEKDVFDPNYITPGNSAIPKLSNQKPD
jgi:heptose-I-phosphate ethanolaminephosphotransferase